MASISYKPTLLSFTLKCSHRALFSFIMCFCHLWNSIAVYQSRIRFKPEAIYHFLVVVRLEFHYGYSLQRTWKNALKVRVTRNLCFFLSKPLLLDYTGLVFRPQMHLYPPPSLVYIPCHILLMKSALVINNKHFPLEFYVFPWVCMETSFLFCSLSTDAWFPYGLLNHRIQGWGLHSSLYFFKRQKCIWCTSKNLNHCSRGEWVNQMEIPTKRVFSTLAAR